MGEMVPNVMKVVPSTRVVSHAAQKKGQAHSLGQMEQDIVEISAVENATVRVSCDTQMAVSILASGSLELCMASAVSCGTMASPILATITKTCDMVLASSIGQMVPFARDVGRMVNCTVQVPMSMVTASSSMDAGFTGSVSIGPIEYVPL